MVARRELVRPSLQEHPPPYLMSKSYNQASDRDSERDHESVLPTMERSAKVMTSA